MSARNSWLIPFLALFINLGVIGGTILWRWDSLIPEVHGEPEPKAVTSDKIYWDQYFAHLHDLETELKLRTNELEEETNGLRQWSEQLERRELELEKRSARLAEQRREMEEWFLSYEDSEQANFEFLAQTYAAMEADKVIHVLATLPAPDVARVLLQMKPDAIAKIWTALIDASQQPHENALRIAEVIDLMRRHHRPEGGDG